MPNKVGGIGLRFPKKRPHYYYANAGNQVKSKIYFQNLKMLGIKLGEQGKITCQTGLDTD
ncbi:MAG TPA: hypothetical protein ENJ95_03975 [Bacteroidetes bacterium]|nr:hypothetical protein [Bacteroidota bacterium]